MVIDAFIVANHPGKIKPRELLNVVTGGFNAMGEKQRGSYAQTVDKVGDNMVKD